MFEIDKSLKSADIPRTIRFHKDLFDNLNNVSKEYNISFNLLILQCCKYAIENMKVK